MELYKNDKLFKEALGAFIIASSEMELNPVKNSISEYC
jgi:hypothetical protein